MKLTEDLLFLLGILCILVTTYLLNLYVGLYLTGIAFLGTAYILNQSKKDRPPEQP